MSSLNEFERRLGYIVQSFRLGAAQIGTCKEYNASLALFKKRLSGSGSSAEGKQKRLHPWLELAISHGWRQDYPQAQDQAPTAQEMDAVCRRLAATLKPIRGAPSRDLLKHHVACFMAAYLCCSGEHIRASRTKNSVYDPHLVGAGGRALGLFMSKLDPDIIETTLANIVLELSRPGSPVERGFRALCPGYGGGVDRETGLPVLGPGFRLDSFEVSHPIYCS